MKKTGLEFSLLNRIALFVFGIVMLIPIVFWLSKSRNELDIRTCFTLIEFFGIACLSLWGGLMWRNDSPKTEVVSTTADRPSNPDDAIVCNFFNFVKSATTVVCQQTNQKCYCSMFLVHSLESLQAG